MCDPEQRIARIKRWCELQENINKKPFPTVDSLDEAELKKVVRKPLVDDKHKVLYCDIAKSG